MDNRRTIVRAGLLSALALAPALPLRRRRDTRPASAWPEAAVLMETSVPILAQRSDRVALRAPVGAGIPDPTGVGPGQVTCGTADGLLAGFWQRSPYEVTGFVWRAGVLRVLPQSSRPNAINKAGFLVGDIISRYSRQAFRWAYGQYQPLGYLGGTDELGGRWSQAAGINVRGQIVGTTSIGNGDRHAYIIAGDGMVDLGTLGGLTSEGVAINDLGQICGNSATATGRSYAFVWSNGHIYSIGALGGGGWSRAVGLNNRSQVVGTSEMSGGVSRAFLWERGRLRALPPLPGDQHTEAVGINDNGEILVRSIGAQTNAFVWFCGRSTRIASLGGRVDPAGIDAEGYVAGTATNAAGNDHAFRWHRGITTDLGTLGGAYSSAACITPSHTVGGGSAVAQGVPQAAFWTL
ncbi:HAF repeat-containing protein [Frankia sp. AgKG'84/4]|uniref:HAF repeat-containing protein n=1 Tax=Frankia sp. AgKG'84/4 TaxID=573490 RepID=UPI00201054DC|nr:HAF repeat-containing protein [Frankia sp. AgKG'84/4]MCL9795358.1 HAF repeat-containing protein [Frankia sp. AgKG'84/4]